MVYTDNIHLIADTVEELHAFAQSIGLKRCWFENHRKPHYDFPKTLNHRQLAIQNGAILKTTKELVKIIQDNK